MLDDPSSGSNVTMYFPCLLGSTVTACSSSSLTRFLHTSSIDVQLDIRIWEYDKTCTIIFRRLFPKPHYTKADGASLIYIYKLDFKISFLLNTLWYLNIKFRDGELLCIRYLSKIWLTLVKIKFLDSCPTDFLNRFCCSKA